MFFGMLALYIEHIRRADLNTSVLKTTEGNNASVLEGVAS